MIDQRSVPLDLAFERPNPADIVEVDLFITSAQAARLEELASREGISVAQYVRRVLQHSLSADASPQNFE